jgi:hypothetical protein
VYEEHAPGRVLFFLRFFFPVRVSRSDFARTRQSCHPRHRTAKNGARTVYGRARPYASRCTGESNLPHRQTKSLHPRSEVANRILTGPFYAGTFADETWISLRGRARSTPTIRPIATQNRQHAWASRRAWDTPLCASAPGDLRALRCAPASVGPSLGRVVACGLVVLVSGVPQRSRNIG